MEPIKISVVLCTYNGEKFLKNQIDSILCQSYMPSEIIIQDDQSTDDTWNILCEYAEKNSRIKIFKNVKRLGLNKNFLTAFKKTTGTHIAISDQDDVWDLNRLKFYVSEFLKTSCSLVYSNSFICNEKLEIVRELNNSIGAIRDSIFKEFTPGHSLVFKKSILTKLKNIENIDLTYDWIIILCSLCTEGAVKINIPLTYWRRHISTVTNLDFRAPLFKTKNLFQIFFGTIFFLLRKNEKRHFKWQFENIYTLLSNFESQNKIKYLIIFLRYYKQESLIKMFISLPFFALSSDLRTVNFFLKAMYTAIYRHYYYERDMAGIRG